MNQRQTPFFILAAFFLALLFVPASSAWVAGIFSRSAPPPLEPQALAIENQALKARLAVLEDAARMLPGESGELLPAFVHSRYPFNFRNELWLDRGEREGVRVGQVVLAVQDPEKNAFVLVGKVTRVWAESSVVQTMFDPAFQIAVRIGRDGVESLLVGGSEPKLSLLPKGSELVPGDAVYAVAAGLPYGLAVGEVAETRPDEAQAFGEATLRAAYDVNRLRGVWLLAL